MRGRSRVGRIGLMQALNHARGRPGTRSDGCWPTVLDFAILATERRVLFRSAVSHGPAPVRMRFGGALVDRGSKSHPSPDVASRPPDHQDNTIVLWRPNRSRGYNTATNERRRCSYKRSHRVTRGDQLREGRLRVAVQLLATLNLTPVRTSAMLRVSVEPTSREILADSRLAGRHLADV